MTPSNAFPFDYEVPRQLVAQEPLRHRADARLMVVNRRRQEIPIVFITAHSDESVRPELLARGAAECLFKPFSEAALIDALNTALRMR